MTAHSQELELKKTTTALFKEIYSVDKISKLKSGNYLKIDKKSKDTLISGAYLDDLKSGVWRYYAKDNKPWMSYDFSKKAFVVFPEEISKIDSFVVRKGNSFSYTKVDSPPVYLGSKNEIGRILNANFTVPKEICENEKSGISMATFVVDQNGKINEFHREKALSDEVFIEMEEVLKLLDGDWSPAIADGKPVDSQILLVCDITQQGTKYLFQDNPKALVIHARYAKEVQNTKKSIGFGVGSE
jgi:hypothetical protein